MCKSFQQGLWNVEKNLLKTLGPNFTPQGLWKTLNSFTPPCGEKNIAALSENGLFHINLYYSCYDCLKPMI